MKVETVKSRCYGANLIFKTGSVGCDEANLIFIFLPTAWHFEKSNSLFAEDERDPTSCDFIFSEAESPGVDMKIGSARSRCEETKSIFDLASERNAPRSTAT